MSVYVIVCKNIAVPGLLTQELLAVLLSLFISPLAALGLQIHAIMPSFMLVQGIQTRVLIFGQVLPIDPSPQPFYNLLK